MKLLLVHGWSVIDTNTYGGLADALARFAPPGLELEISHIYLGRYISFDDNVRMDDLALAFERARRELLGDEPFSVITHSTGAPVMRSWLKRYYPNSLATCPLRHLIMLAPANHGSALAQLGKSRLGRIKAWFDDVEPGQQVLDWLELGSEGQRQLSDYWLGQSPVAEGVYPFVISGETIDSKLYDFLNSYTAEPGSDGVVRLAAANLNYRALTLREVDCEPPVASDGAIACVPFELVSERVAPACAFEVLPKASHSGSKLGIMASVSSRTKEPQTVVSSILACLKVATPTDYEAEMAAMAGRSKQRGARYCQLVIRVWDDEGHSVPDFDFLLLGGPDYDPNRLPKGFFQDRQKNQRVGNALTLYLNHDKMLKLAEQCWGFRIVPRPDKGLCHYRAAEYRACASVADELKPNQTLMLDLVLKRRVHANVFSFTQEGGDFRDLAKV
ncbi:alpha/beta hydrolase [Shewanella sp. JM162201]|uniref:Alpha/beta hydrolase n=1 Tax=Shewanella jiangmenensis TaxID=2837387 RepID=A0ABS5V4J9_9GAMM|nr:alpha/beta hydrolase [Shewanella jiangmenensis]MBT1445383.1 alpha/beta hydrolase [Shewanella jiangmenensis]